MKTCQYQFIFNDTFHNDSCDGQFPLQKQSATTVVFEQDQPWMAPLDEFIKFLSSIYGYDISDSVTYETLEEKLKKHIPNYEDDEDIYGDVGREFE